MTNFIIILLIQGFFFGVFTSYIAAQKNRDTFNWFILGFLFSLLALLAIVGIPALKDKAESISQQPIQRFNGELDLNNSSYQLFLVNTFSIEKNNTLEKYTFDNGVYDSLQDALKTANDKYISMSHYYSNINSSTPPKSSKEPPGPGLLYALTFIFLLIFYAIYNIFNKST